MPHGDLGSSGPGQGIPAKVMWAVVGSHSTPPSQAWAEKHGNHLLFRVQGAEVVTWLKKKKKKAKATKNSDCQPSSLSSIGCLLNWPTAPTWRFHFYVGSFPSVLVNAIHILDAPCVTQPPRAVLPSRRGNKAHHGGALLCRGLGIFLTSAFESVG